jgi:hypothetical protein
MFVPFLHMGRSNYRKSLLVGVSLQHAALGSAQAFNLHAPHIVRQFVLFALDNGWTGEQALMFDDGLEVLHELGYDVSGLKSV